MKSVFTEKEIQPTNETLSKALGDLYPLWKTISDYCIGMYPDAIVHWHFSGEKYGWAYRISDKKRVLIYLLPRDGFFKVAFVFGQRAMNEIEKSSIAESIKQELKEAKVYAEGRGIRIEVKNNYILNDIQELIAIKIQN